MADIKKTVEIVFSGTDDISQSIGDIAGSVQGLTAPLANAAEGILKTNAAIVATGVAVAGLSLVKAGDFETAFNKTAAIVDTTDKNLSTFKDNLLDYSRVSNQSLDSITDATFNAISAGTEYKDVIASLGVAEKLATAGQADLNDSLSLISKTINAYGLEASDSERLAEIFFETNRLGITTITELSASLAGVTGTAATAGVPIEEVTAALATLTASGVPTTQAVTQIKAVLSNLIKPSEGAKTAAKELGIEFNTTALKSQGFQKFLLGVFDQADGNVDVLGQLFGSVEALGAVSVLGANSNNKYVESLEAIQNASGNIDTALDKVGKSFEQTNQTLLNNIDATLIAVGSKLLDGYGGMADSVVEVLKSLGTSIQSGSFDELFDFVNNSFEDAANALSAVAKSLPAALDGVDFGKLTSALENAKEAAIDLFDLSASDTGAEGLEGFIQSVVDALSAIVEIGAGVTRGIEPAIDAIKLFFAALEEIGPENIRAIGLALGTAFAVDKLAGVATGVSSVASAASQLGLKLKDINPSKLKDISSSLKTMGAAGLALGAGTLAINAFFDALNERQDEEEAASKASTDRSLANINETRADIVRSVQEQFKELGGVYEGGWEGIKDLTKQGLVDITGQGTGTLTVGVDDSKLREFIRRGDLKKTTADFLALNIPAEGAAKTIDSVGDSAITSGDKLKKVDEDSEKFRATLAKIASDERIKTFEFTADIKTAQIEADSQKVVASFDSISNAITGASNILDSLFGALGNADLSRFDKLEIQSNIDEQVQLQKDSLALQERLIEAELERQRIINKQIAEGGGLITIDSTGLEPSLELVMFEIIEKVQVRLVEQGLPALLGV